jgi:polyphosphate kinase
MNKKTYFDELRRLQLELIKLQRWIIDQQKRVIVLFEGRDAAGKGGTIKRIASVLNPRVCKIAALAKPTDREQSQWYFQRYVQHFPSAGELVLFDRSWYNRAGVERVMGFCSPEKVQEFLEACPDFEKMVINSGITLIKYWFSVSAREQEKRFQARIKDPTKTWKISPMDLESRARWSAYSEAKDEMFEFTDTEECPWNVVPADDKRNARLNCIHHLLSSIPYTDLPPAIVELPPRPKESYIRRSPMSKQSFVPQIYT